jgi:hypothetical protein
MDKNRLVLDGSLQIELISNIRRWASFLHKAFD